MLKSFVHAHNTPKHGQHLVLVDNSTDELTRGLLYDNKVPYKCSPGNTHGQGINEALELCKTDYALLVDTDVIFLKDHTEIFEQFKKLNLIMMGKIEGSRGGKNIYNRVNPWHCFINVKLMKENNLTYFNAKKMKDSFSENYIYDIGSTFFEDARNLNLNIGNVDLSNSYFLHLEGMSWYKNKYNPHDKDTGIDFGGTHNNIGFVHAYEQKYKMFESIKENYSNVKVSDKFIY
jgi:hypothetical protein